MRTDPNYIDPATVTKLRIFWAGDWNVDGINERGGFTESCWSFDTYAEAIAALEEFYQSLGLGQSRSGG
jgi:hypothetical protein